MTVLAWVRVEWPWRPAAVYPLAEYLELPTATLAGSVARFVDRSEYVRHRAAERGDLRGAA